MNNQENKTSPKNECIPCVGGNALIIVPFMGEKYYKLFSPLQKETGITQGEIDVIAFLYNHPQYHCACDLVEIRGISRSHASEAVNKLVKKGYLTREHDKQNRRKIILTITDEAIPLCERIREIQLDYQNTLVSGIDEKDLETFAKVLRQQYINLGGKPHDGII